MAWIFWGISVLAVLCSFFTSTMAMETAIRRIDRGEQISDEIGGLPDCWTRGLNCTSGGSFMIGLGFFIFFVYNHL
jgi:heme/copper-type cytochrome/quinol oxidase subunit 1